MPVSADTLRILMAAGVTGEALLKAVESIDADMRAAAPPQKERSAGAERQARYRARLTGTVTDSDVTPLRNSDVTPPPYERSNPPEPSLRSERERAGREAVPEFRSAYPRKPGAKWQQANEKFIRLVRDGTDPSKILDGARRFAEFRAGEDPKYTPDPVVWLNGSRWLDDFDKPLPKAANGARAGPNNSDPIRDTTTAAAIRYLQNMNC